MNQPGDDAAGHVGEGWSRDDPVDGPRPHGQGGGDGASKEEDAEYGAGLTAGKGRGSGAERGTAGYEDGSASPRQRAPTQWCTRGRWLPAIQGRV
jgi:hypothetical protein